MIKSLYRAVRKSARPLKQMWVRRSNASIFDEIYEKGFWGTSPDDPELFYSGLGSRDPSVVDYVNLVKSIIEKFCVKSITEIGCGDFAVASQYAALCSEYTGIDVVRRLVDYNSRMFAKDGIRFICKDATRGKLAPSDLCIIRQVLQHLSNKDIQSILNNHQSKYLLITEHLPSRENTVTFNADKKTGGDIRAQFGSGVFIDKPPFNLEAQVVIDRSISDDGSRLVTWIVTQPKSMAPSH